MRPERWGRWRAALVRAFATGEGPQAVAPEDLACLDRIAAAVARRGLTAPALLFLESLAPLSFLAGQALHAAKPLLELAGGPQDAERLAGLLERRGTLALLQARIEAAAAAGAPGARHGRGSGPGGA